MSLPAKRADDTHARQILLCDGGQLPFVFIARHEALFDDFVEVDGIADDDRQRQHGDQRQRPVHADHEEQREAKHDRHAQKRSQLV